MKNLFEIIFKKEPQLNYIIAAYQPMEVSVLRTSSQTSEYDLDAPTELDEMNIDKIYQRS